MGRSVRTSRPSTGRSTWPALSPRPGTPPSPSGMRCNRVPGFEAFIIPVLLFPGTPPDRLIQEWAGQLRVKVLFGADDLMDRLLALADSVGVKHPPTAGRIRNEVAAVTSGLVAPARDGGGHEAVQEFMAGQVVIQHVDTVNIYVTLAHVDGRDPQRLPAAGPISTSPPAG